MNQVLVLRVSSWGELIQVAVKCKIAKGFPRGLIGVDVGCPSDPRWTPVGSPHAKVVSDRRGRYHGEASHAAVPQLSTLLK